MYPERLLQLRKKREYELKRKRENEEKKIQEMLKKFRPNLEEGKVLRIEKSLLISMTNISIHNSSS